MHDVERRRIGSVYADVTVPDFETAPLSLSGVALSLAVVFDEAQRLTSRAFNVATRGADVTWRLPLERLTPGEYLLTLHAELEGTPESTVERKVRFSVTPGG